MDCFIHVTSFNSTPTSFPDSSVGKESACNAGDPCSISGSGRSPGEGIGYPLQHSQVSLVVQLVKQYGRPGFSPWVGKIPWRREKPSTPVFLPREFHGLYSLWNSLGQHTGMGTLSLLQGIFPTEGWNPGLPHCRWILYQVSQEGSPRILEW